MSVEVSVVIPSFNHAVYLEEAVLSSLNQTVNSLEVIVVDDGSIDNSLELLAAILDPRLRVISQTNQGAHAAINRGLAEAKGEFLAILNSDDAYHLQRLEVLVNQLKQDSRIGLIGSYIEVVDSQGSHLGVKRGYQSLEPWSLDYPEHSFRAGDNRYDALLTENYFATTSNFVFRRSWYKEIGPFLPLRYAHDWDFALRVSKQARLELVPEPLLRYRIHASNTIRENQAAMIFEICWCLAMHLPQAVPILEAASPQIIQRLLYSIYTFGCDQVLVVMLLQQLFLNPQKALDLLQSSNPNRLHYLEFIESHLNSLVETNQGGKDPVSYRSVAEEGFLSGWSEKLGLKLKTWLKS